MKGPSPGVRVALLAGSALVLLVALARVGTWHDPYAPNDWLFSHTWLAQEALDSGRIPFNDELLSHGDLAASVRDFRAELGLERMTFYASTIWHFWNGLPLQPALLASLSALLGVSPEDASRIPLGGAAVLLLAYAAADLLLSRSQGEPRVAALAPFVVAFASAPLLLDLRVLMPSTSLVIVSLLLLLLLRRTLLRDGNALPAALVPLALLPFWYYTVSYFVIALFAGFLVANLLLKARGAETPPVAPLLVAALVPVALAGVLILDGALTSHLQMAGNLRSVPFLGGEAGSDYTSHLNRTPWRSALLYAQLALLFAPLLAVGARAALDLARTRRAEPAPAMFAQWMAGGALFSVAMQGAVGVSFLNRGAIYLTPLAVLGLAWALARHWERPRVRRALAGGTAFCLVASAALVATAGPTYGAGDRDAFRWVGAHVDREAVVYASLDASSVLFRTEGFEDVIAFEPRTRLLEDFWYGTDVNATVVYLESFEYFVLRDAAKRTGFEEFGPLREPISEAAYAKFRTSRDLQLVFDNGAVQVFQVALDPERYVGR